MSNSSAVCIYCGRSITFSQQHTFEGVCDDRECRRLQIQGWVDQKRRIEAERLRIRRQAANQAWEADVRFTFKEQSQSVDSIESTPRPAYPLPVMQQTLTELPPARHEAFLTHLTSIIDKAFQSNEVSQVDAVDPSSDEFDQHTAGANPHPIWSTACGTCGGACCINGGTHAYITVRLIERIRRLKSGITPQQVELLYRSYLPGLSYEDSCVYHRQAGCALPRNLRDDVCNTFECVDLQYIRNQGITGSAVFVALDELTPVRMTEYTPEGQEAQRICEPVSVLSEPDRL